MPSLKSIGVTAAIAVFAIIVAKRLPVVKTYL